MTFHSIHASLIANSIPHIVATKAALMLSGVAERDSRDEKWVEGQIQAFLGDYIQQEGDLEIIFMLLDERMQK